MNSIKGYQVPQNVLCNWEQNWVPDFDLFYFVEKPECIPVYTIEEINKKFLTLNVRTSFLTWSIDKRAKYVSHVSNKDFLALLPHVKREIIAEQKRLNRGLMFTEIEMRSLLEGLDLTDQNECLVMLKQNAYNDEIVSLQGHIWRRLSYKTRQTILVNYADLWVDEHALDNGEIVHYRNKYPNLSAYINVFPGQNGPNCLASVIAGITNSASSIHQWMQQDTFLQLLFDSKYVENETNRLSASDVIVWFDLHDRPVHAALLLSEEHAFNKNGQTMFHPWQIIRIDHLMDCWQGYRFTIYRKT
ncbi:hypothetical protein KUV80_13835 [Fictibacillus nanhaiensis]|uniref:hypothetical protein n=1 Tax=Fictibacillus nanhaiensis TaxID=742169 RepID=UPI001C984E99|nr:hypothetical protein [Fictibacillus nanhaiensis]MBY6037747.1 hypothetical protein [Fictibacillus nanhaiensis]